MKMSSRNEYWRKWLIGESRGSRHVGHVFHSRCRDDSVICHNKLTTLAVFMQGTLMSSRTLKRSRDGFNV